MTTLIKGTCYIFLTLMDLAELHRLQVAKQKMPRAPYPCGILSQMSKTEHTVLPTSLPREAPATAAAVAAYSAKPLMQQLP